MLAVTGLSTWAPKAQGLLTDRRRSLDASLRKRQLALNGPPHKS